MNPPLFDTHVHFWDHSLRGFSWPWLEEGFSHRKVEGTHVLDAPRYTVPEFREEARGAGVGGMVHAHAATEMGDPARETEWLTAMAETHGWPNAMIGWCVLDDPGAPDLLHRHARFPRASSVRDVTAAQGLDVEASIPALDAASALGFSVEVRVPLEAFPTLARIAERWPDLTVVLGHGCLPLERSEADLEDWTRAVRELAQRPNVMCKISAVAGSSDPDWTVESIRPWILRCVDVFGPDRAMFGTNWPIDRLHGRYVDVVAAYRESTASLSEGDRAALFHRTAARLYRVPEEELVGGPR